MVVANENSHKGNGSWNFLLQPNFDQLSECPQFSRRVAKKGKRVGWKLKREFHYKSMAEIVLTKRLAHWLDYKQRKNRVIRKAHLTVFRIVGRLRYTLKNKYDPRG